MSTRRIFVNVLVNGAPYQNRVAIDIPSDTEVSDKVYAHMLISDVALTDNIPFKLLSYEIVNEVIDIQRKILNHINCDIWTAINEGQSDFYMDRITFKDDNLIIEYAAGCTATIRAKDIIIKN